MFSRITDRYDRDHKLVIRDSEHRADLSLDKESHPAGPQPLPVCLKKDVLNGDSGVADGAFKLPVRTVFVEVQTWFGLDAGSHISDCHNESRRCHHPCLLVAGFHNCMALLFTLYHDEHPWLLVVA